MEAEAALRRALAAIDGQVRQRIHLIARRDTQLQAGRTAAAELTEIADTLVANAETGAAAVISGLYDLETDPVSSLDTRLEALDKLIELDLFQMGLMFELRAHASEIGLLLNRVTGVRSQDELDTIRQDLDLRAKAIARRLASVNDPRRAEHALVLLRATGTGMAYST